MKTAIVGCGYVGCELARKLDERGHDVVAVRRSRRALDTIAKIGAHVEPVSANVTAPETLPAIPDVDAIVYAVSAGGRDPETAEKAYNEGLRNVITEFGARESSPERLLYTSSTGVYGDHDGGWVDETTAIDPSGPRKRVLAKAETLVLEKAPEHGLTGTVVRFGGLYGPDRYRLTRYLEGPVTAGILNMIHRDDAAGVLAFLLEKDSGQDSIVVAVDDEPVDKHEFANWLADQCSVPRPPKQSIDERLASKDLTEATKQRIRSNKRCSNQLIKDMGYEFVHPTFRSGYQEAIEGYLEEMD